MAGKQVHEQANAARKLASAEREEGVPRLFHVRSFPEQAVANLHPPTLRSKPHGHSPPGMAGRPCSLLRELRFVCRREEATKPNES